MKSKIGKRGFTIENKDDFTGSHSKSLRELFLRINSLYKEAVSPVANTTTIYEGSPMLLCIIESLPSQTAFFKSVN